MKEKLKTEIANDYLGCELSELEKSEIEIIEITAKVIAKKIFEELIEEAKSNHDNNVHIWYIDTMRKKWCK